MEEVIITEEPKQEDPEQGVRKQLRLFRHSIDQCKQYRRKLISDWNTNIDYRRGKPYPSQSDEDRIAVPLDWSLTKEKESQLFSQVPAVRVSHPPQTIAEGATSWMHAYEQKINDTVIQAGIEAVMTETLPDCINAAGIGVAMISREAITETVLMPAIDLSMFPPELKAEIEQNKMLPDGTPVPMIPTPREVDSRYVTARISPSDFLWPLGFTGSDFDMAPWLGRSGRVSWSESVQMFGLTEEDKSKVVGEARTHQDRMDKQAFESDADLDLHEESVGFDEIFYRTRFYDSGARSFYSINHIVFVDGKKEPVINEPWKGQRMDPETGVLLGSMKFPIRVLTLAYISDDAIPPSDTAVGRPQVDEINKSRSQMILQRERSLPVNWFDVNRVDPTIQIALMRGTWQGYIPVQGQGTNIIGSVQRSIMPQDNYAFDKIAKNDLNNSWQTAGGQWGSDIETRAEVDAVGATMEVRVARERAKVGKFFVGITEVLGGLISIFEDPQSFGEGFSPFVSRVLSYSILADSTVLLDSNQRLKKLMQFINFTAKSGWVDLEPVLKEIATLSGLDPSSVIKPPSPKPPVEPNISLRLTGVEDLYNPLTLAFLINSGQAPDLKLIEQAKKLIEAAVVKAPLPPSPEEGMPPMDGEMPPEEPPMELPQPPVPGVGDANPQWGAMSRINKRTIDHE